MLNIYIYMYYNHDKNNNNKYVKNTKNVPYIYIIHVHMINKK